jgi:hypothetical protein
MFFLTYYGKIYCRKSRTNGFPLEIIQNVSLRALYLLDETFLKVDLLSVRNKPLKVASLICELHVKQNLIVVSYFVGLEVAHVEVVGQQ